MMHHQEKNPTNNPLAGPEDSKAAVGSDIPSKVPVTRTDTDDEFDDVAEEGEE